ncbi:MAG: phosphotransferase enzyme family protein [Clostridia bacterium]|jgi:hypothetical protein
MNSQIIEMLKRVSEYYDLPGTLESFRECKNGHINTTYIVDFASGGTVKEYIFQKINSYVFKEPEKVMSNIKEIGRHLQSRKSDTDCDIITFLDNREGKNHTLLDGDYWRVCPYVPNSVTYETVENSKVLASAGYAFGRFQALLSDFPMEKLHETIPDFHNTRKRLEDFFEVVDRDPVGRAAEVQEEIAFFEKHRSIATRLVELQEKGELPLRVTHNDTKYNNILMHRESCEPLCVIDLDTVMPGLAMYDFGDAIRFAANTAPEDETDLSKVGLNMDHYREFTRGFMKAAGDFLTEKEKENMALGAMVITIELASRFLADHLDGDKYFRIHRENHNLDRARCQIRLAQDMLDKYEEMCKIVREI